MELCDPVYVEEQDLEFLTMEKVILFQLQQLVHSSSPFSRAFCGIVETIRYLSSRAHRLSERWGNIPVVLTGDFNSTPQSAIYKFLSSSKLNIMSYNRKELSGQRNCRPAQVFGIEREIESPFRLVDRIMDFCWNIEDVRTATGSADNQVVEHPLKLTSSYATLRGSKETRGTNGEPLATSYHSKFLGTVDYIWYSQGLEPTRLLDTLPMDVLRKTKGLPYKKLGSDHLALVTEFVFTEAEEDNSDNEAATLSSPAVSSSLASESKDDTSLP
ncbi:Endonuclease/exonuclease/phosphatase [Dillenia turbinata]|uniref:Endonuclease/exonuclease/phosphatase n=1 Tax=Dillenia turbinata TaxID=194707 RepID=A0AAN8YZQ1_9MAGN